MPRRRTYNINPSKEYEFRPCMRQFEDRGESKNETVKEGIKVICPSFTEGKGRPEKKHYFEYRQQHVKEMQSKIHDFNNKQTLNDEFRALSKIGFSQKALDNLPNNKLLSLNFSQGINEFNFHFKNNFRQCDF